MPSPPRCCCSISWKPDERATDRRRPADERARPHGGGGRADRSRSSSAAAPAPTPAPERVTLPPGATLRRRDRHARRPRVIARPRVFKLIARVRGRRPRRSRPGCTSSRPAPRPGGCSTCCAKGAAVSAEVHGPRRTHHPRGRGPRRGAAGAAGGLGARRRAGTAPRPPPCWASRSQSFEGFLRPGDLLPALRRASRRAGADHGRGLQGRLGAGLDGAARLPRHDPAPAGHLRLHRRGRGPRRRRARDDRGGVSQPAPDRHGAPGRPDGAVRHHPGHRAAEAAAVSRRTTSSRRPTTPTSTPGCRPAR